MPKRNNLPDLPLKAMSIGDSFPLDMETENDSRAVQTLRQRISRFQANHPEYRFSVGKDPVGDGMRVWRVA